MRALLLGIGSQNDPEGAAFKYEVVDAPTGQLIDTDWSDARISRCS
jgi:hypothetical protein